jgi:hypothetical protein
MRSHLIRHCKGVLELHPQWQAWAGQVRDILREAAAAVEAARNDRKTKLDSGLLADLRARYDEQIAWGITTNRLREWHKGRHPGYNLAGRLQDKAEQVCYSPGRSRFPGRIMPRSTPSRARSDTRPSPGTGIPPPRSPTTAGCAPTWSAHADTASAPPTPSTPPSPANPGYRCP